MDSVDKKLISSGVALSYPGFEKRTSHLNKKFFKLKLGQWTYTHKVMKKRRLSDFQCFYQLIKVKANFFQAESPRIEYHALRDLKYFWTHL